jgi:membrane-associated phospholipid phosphatase
MPSAMKKLDVLYAGDHPPLAAAASAPRSQRMLAALYFLAVAAVFAGGYQLTLQRAARLAPRADTWTRLDAWVPLWPWSIVPYCSLDLVYPAAFFICSRYEALRRLSVRLLLVQGLSFVCFWWLPFRMQRVVPEVQGLAGRLYQWLGLFDGSGNLLPSLHIGVLGVLWWTLLPNVALRYRLVWHAWAVSVCVSALTTWQHHLLDVLAGGLLAFAVLRATSREVLR